MHSAKIWIAKIIRIDLIEFLSAVLECLDRSMHYAALANAIHDKLK
jgi:hypothetical protein